MAEQTPLKATFFAFQKREPGGVLAKATIAYLAIALVLGVAFFALNWRMLGPVGTWYVTALETPPGSAPAFAQPPQELLFVLPSYLVMLVVTFILLAAYEAACLRWLTRGETEGLWGLSLGADTWRVWAGYWLWMLVILAVYIIAIVIALVLVFALTFLSKAIPGFAGVVGFLIFFAILFAYLLPAYLVVRLAPAAATSVARRKFSFFSAWTVTRGRFWALFGSFFLLCLILFGGSFIAYGGMVFAILGAAVGDIASSGGVNSVLPEAVIAAFTSTTGIVTLAIFYIALIAFTMAIYVAFYGVNARAALAALEEGKIAPEATPSASAAS